MILYIKKQVNKYFRSSSSSVFIENCAKLPQYLTHSTETPKLKIATVMDEFSFKVFSYEAELIHLDIHNYEQQIVDFQPDFIFIESAWFGYQKQWKGKISIVGRKVFELLDYANKNDIISVFWNKEDPISFKHFFPIAKRVNFIFTTELSCVTNYRKLLGHDRVFYLNFAVQPLLHNPIEEFVRRDKFFFAGAYYVRFKERREDFERLIKLADKIKPIEIYDRNFGITKHWNVFPDEYVKYIVGGGIDFNEISKIYKSYKYAINVNTVKHGKSMFSRRVFELAASNVLMLSNYSRGLHRILKNDFFSSDNEKYLQKYLQLISTDNVLYRKLRLLVLREVMYEHTYFQRIGVIKSAISGNNYSSNLPKVIIIIIAKNMSDINNGIVKFNQQTYKNKEMIILKTSEFYLGAISSNIKIFNSSVELSDSLFSLRDASNNLLAYFSNRDCYEKNYILDLVLGFKYSQAYAIGKACYYQVKRNGSYQLINPNKQYKLARSLKLRRSIVRLSNIYYDTLLKWLQDGDEATITWNKNYKLSLDEFNYCQDGGLLGLESLKRLINDVDPVNELRKIND